MSNDIEQHLREMFRADSEAAPVGAPATSPATAGATLTWARVLTVAALVSVIALAVWTVPGLLPRGATRPPVASPAPASCPQHLAAAPATTTTVQASLSKGAVMETLVCDYQLGSTSQASSMPSLRTVTRIQGDPFGPYFAASKLPSVGCPADLMVPGGVAVLTYANGAHDMFEIEPSGCGEVRGPGSSWTNIDARYLVRFLLTQTGKSANASVMVQALQTSTGSRPFPVHGRITLTSGSSRHTLTTDEYGLVVADLPSGTYGVEDPSFTSTSPQGPISCTAPNSVTVTSNRIALLPVTCPL